MIGWRGLALAMLAWGVATAPGEAQGRRGMLGIPIAVEVIPTVAFGVGNFAAADPGPGATLGYGVEAGATLGLGSTLALYGDYQYLLFQCGECEDFALDSRMVDAGFEAGAQVALPLVVAGTRPWVRAGVVGHQLQLSDPDATATSELALGFGVGGGVDLPLAGSLTLSPLIRFRSYSAGFNLQQFDDRGTDVTYVAAGLGLRYHF